MTLTPEEERAARAADRGRAPLDTGGTDRGEMIRAATARLVAIQNLPHSGPRGVSQAARLALTRAAENSLARLEGRPAPHKLKRREPADDTIWPKGDPRGPLERNR